MLYSQQRIADGHCPAESQDRAGGMKNGEDRSRKTAVYPRQTKSEHGFEETADCDLTHTSRLSARAGVTALVGAGWTDSLRATEMEIASGGPPL